MLYKFRSFSHCHVSEDIFPNPQMLHAWLTTWFHPSFVIECLGDGACDVILLNPLDFGNKNKFFREGWESFAHKKNNFCLFYKFPQPNYFWTIFSQCSSDSSFGSVSLKVSKFIIIVQIFRLHDLDPQVLIFDCLQPPMDHTTPGPSHQVSLVFSLLAVVAKIGHY